MKKKAKLNDAAKSGRVTRVKLTPEESLRRMEEFDKPQQPETAVSRSERPARAKLTPDEIKKRMQDFPTRRENFIAAIRKNKD